MKCKSCEEEEAFYMVEVRDMLGKVEDSVALCKKCIKSVRIDPTLKPMIGVD